MLQRIVGGGGHREGVAGWEDAGNSLLKKKKKCMTSYLSFKTPLKFPLPWEAFLISKGYHLVLPESSLRAPSQPPNPSP